MCKRKSSVNSDIESKLHPASTFRKGGGKDPGKMACQLTWNPHEPVDEKEGIHIPTSQM